MSRTNVQLKDSYDIEPYLNSHLPAKYIALMSKLRIVTHKLDIENESTANPPLSQFQKVHGMPNRDGFHFLGHRERYKRVKTNIYSVFITDNSTILFGFRQDKKSIFQSTNTNILLGFGKCIAECITSGTH